MKMKRITTIVLASCLTLCLASPVFAADYQYNVEVSGGLHGTVSGNTNSEVNKGYSWSPNDYSVSADDGYYFKGFHISGQEGIVGSTVITEDTTFVATYGITGEQDLIAYTVHYVEDGTGNTLAQDRRYYGLAGDKPVVAYQNIDGYLPRDAYNLTRTIRAGEDNDFTFYYVPSTTTIITTTTTTEETAAGTTGTTGAAAGTATGGTAGTAAGTGAAAGGTAGTAAGGDGADTAGAGDTGDAGTTGPADIVDLDDEEVPLAGVDQDDTEEAGDMEDIADSATPTAGVSTAAKAGIGVIIAAAIVALIAALAVRARRRKYKEES